MIPGVLFGLIRSLVRHLIKIAEGQSGIAAAESDTDANDYISVAKLWNFYTDDIGEEPVNDAVCVLDGAYVNSIRRELVAAQTHNDIV